MENAWSNSSNSSQNYSFQYFMFCMYFWPFSRNTKPGYQDLGAGRGKGRQGRGQWRGEREGERERERGGGRGRERERESVGKEFVETRLIEGCPR